MKKFFGITFGGIQQKITNLVLIILVALIALFSVITLYANNMLTGIVEETRDEQQQAISQTSQQALYERLDQSLAQATALKAKIADNDFAEIVNDAYMIKTLAQELLRNRATLTPVSVAPPDPALDGVTSAMVLCEEGVDYTQSEYLGIIAHMSTPMIAMQSNSDKIDSCYIGLKDGTDLCVDDRTLIKLDENGKQRPFPVRERPWYTGAVEAGGLYFTSIITDAFTGARVITCSLPIEVDDEVLGVVGVDIMLESMADFENDPGDIAGYTYIVDDQGRTVMGQELGGPFGEDAAGIQPEENPELDSFLKMALRENTGVTRLTLGGRDYYLAGAPMFTVGWAVISAVDQDVTAQPARQMLSEYDRINETASAKYKNGSSGIQRAFIIILAALLAAGLLAALITSKRIAKPINEMTKNVVEAGRTGTLFEMKDTYKTNDEIEVLAESFDDLSRKTRKYISDITAITAEKERISTELNMATRIQASMLPHVFPPFPDRKEINLFASMDPAREVGGDFYDFFFIDNDHLCLVIADVSGKGVPAALFMMVSKVILQSCAMLGQSAADILIKTNEALCSNNQVQMFVTVWLGILELSTGRLTAANAGHEYPTIKRAGGKFELFKDPHGFVIGGMPGMKYKEYRLDLNPGDKLFVYTDGVPEATNAQKQLFGTDRMLGALNESPDAAPEELLRNVRGAVDRFVMDAEQFDDLTMLCLEYKGTGEEDRAGDNTQTSD